MRSNTFTDRREAEALFNQVRGRHPDKAWPLLPWLAFIGPGGCGKSTLLEYLRATYCQSTLPHAHIDFTIRDPPAPKSMLDILITLRNQLQGQADDYGKYLTFPSFDLGASIAAAFTDGKRLPSLDKGELEQKLTEAQQIFATLADMGNVLGSILPVIPAVVSGLKLTAGVTKLAGLPPLRALIKRIESGPGWQWYRRHGSDTGLLANASVEMVLTRLYTMSTPGTEAREKLVRELLPAAFIDDLCEALLDPIRPKAWSKSANVVILLDGYEDLPEYLGQWLLTTFACSQRRKRGETDPLLVVVGSRDRLLKHTTKEQFNEENILFESPALLSENDAKLWAKTYFDQFERKLPAAKNDLHLRDLYLPVFLRVFSDEDIDHLLLQLARERVLEEVFSGKAGEQLVPSIQRVTKGYPLYVILAAEAAFAAKRRGETLKLDEFDHLLVSSERKEDTEIGEYLLEKFLSQLDEEEQKLLVFSSAIRTLSAESLKFALDLPSVYDAEKRLRRYRQYTFFRSLSEKRLTVHPIVHELLQKRLPEPDYIEIHTRLRKHYSQGAEHGDRSARIGEIYHALALGDPEPAIKLGITALREDFTLWETLLETIAEAPTAQLPPDTGVKATEALKKAEQQHDVEQCVRAIVLCNWLLTASQGDTRRTALWHLNMGVAYYNLLTGDRQVNLEKAILYYKNALEDFTRKDYPRQWAWTQLNLGTAYSKFLGGDASDNLGEAIKCYQEALIVFTRKDYLSEWAWTQFDLGTAYYDLAGRKDRASNLKKAIGCYQEALDVYIRVDPPSERARAQNNLGRAYYDLASEENRAVNLKKAIEYYQEALIVFTHKDYAYWWAWTQLHLGKAHQALANEENNAVNRGAAKRCYEEALKVFTSKNHPYEYAEVRDNLKKLNSAFS